MLAGGAGSKRASMRSTPASTPSTAGSTRLRRGARRLSELQAHRTIAKIAPEPVREIAAPERERQQGLADAAQARLYDTTPDGLRTRAAALRAEREQRALLVADARLLLEDQGLPI